MQTRYISTIKKVEILNALLDLKEYNKLKHACDIVINDKFLGWLSSELKLKFQKVFLEIESENYGAAKNLLEIIIGSLRKLLFETPCEEKWNDLVQTEDGKVRYCGLCRKNVFKVTSKEELFKRVSLKQCVAYDKDFLENSTVELIEELTGSTCMIEIEVILNSRTELLGMPVEINF